MASSYHRSVPFDSLPDDVLIEIVSYFGAQEDIPKRFRVAHALSRVNKRLRDFALPILLRSINVSGVIEFKSLLAYFSSRGQPYARYVRRLCFPPLFNFPNQYIPYFDAGESLFPNLTTFNCCEWLVDSNWFRLVLNHQNLRHLSMPYSADRWFPALRRFPRLDSLYLVLVPGHRPFCPRAGSSLHVYHSLTRLSVHHSPDAQWPQLAWCTLKFPNLKALNIQGIISCPPRTIYGFIQRHSTLLEVNVGFKNALLRLEGLIKLMNGTGTWNTPESTAINRSQPIIPQRVAIACSRDQVNFKTFHGTRIPVPDDMPGSRTTFSRFGFVREPITADAIQWRSSKGSEEARYNVTSLALGIQNLRRFPSTTFEGFLRLSSYFPTLKELRVESVVEVPKNSNFVSYMNRIGPLLAQWKGLRKISFSYAFDINWTWGTTSPYLDPEPHIDVVNEYLDDVDPTWQGGPYSLNMVRKDYPDLCDDIEERIRTILPDEETIDPNDRTLILRVWEILHYHRVANVMSSLVEKCPTLEEIEWFPMAVSERDGEGETKSLWKWKVQQGIRGHYGPHRVSGSYTYKRCPSGDPPPLYILVGEELKRTLEQRVRKY